MSRAKHLKQIVANTKPESATFSQLRSALVAASHLGLISSVAIDEAHMRDQLTSVRLTAFGVR